MIRTRYTITPREGVKTELLFTLSLFAIAKRRGVALAVEDFGDTTQRMDFFIKLIWCAAHNAWEYRRMEDPSLGDLDLSILDVAEWAGDHPKDFAAIIRGASEAISGKELPEGDAAEKALADEKKKKSSTTTTRRSRSSSSAAAVRAWAERCSWGRRSTGTCSHGTRRTGSTTTRWRAGYATA
jgi:hypothetical protein